MKRTYIQYKGIKYPTENCKFFKDCIEYYDEIAPDVITIPHETWEYVEEEIVFDELTSQERWKFEVEESRKQHEHERALLIEFQKLYGKKPKDLAYSQTSIDWHRNFKAYCEKHPRIDNLLRKEETNERKGDNISPLYYDEED